MEQGGAETRSRSFVSAKYVNALLILIKNSLTKLVQSDLILSCITNALRYLRWDTTIYDHTYSRPIFDDEDEGDIYVFFLD